MLKVPFPNVSFIISSSSDQCLSFVMSPGCTRPEDGALLLWIIESSSSRGQLSQGALCSRVSEGSLLSSFILASAQVGQPWTNFKMVS